MYHNVKIENFRTFSCFDIKELGQVNLFVGRNNAGKTAILEALEILMSNHWRVLLKSSDRRNEYIETLGIPYIDISHLFTGHYLDVNSWFQISGIARNEQQKQFIKLNLIDNSDELEKRLTVQIESSYLEKSLSMSLEKFMYDDRHIDIKNFSKSPLFLSTSGANDEQLQRLWDSIVATPAEEKVYEALLSVLPTLERIVFTSSNRGNVFIKLKNTERLPLGSMGEGVRRLLGLAIYIVKSEGKYLLIDEIDTGLHYSVIEDLWRFIVQTAKQFNVQVFATTHSSDCVRALAWLQADQPELAKEVVLYRVEPNATQAIRYSSEELEIAARHHIEVRG
ncbi:hypothetical protein BegalDRAFT_1399 [Beggiatoa alba B18LD]|uniref:Endonuclease GajA/Old nuclease/RecF-like AAA domain-containing protein n=1 Tax=Beggiatoa alba B18LD TaxID=395493 RepID=I3CFA0_9GAMM|nr:ATP-binding protein [Beggiatoa alba]EIJ42293.1 hypothetical protein BegalDRAFT_1399 [Beggiatoa alba B18LD]